MNLPTIVLLLLGLVSLSVSNSPTPMASVPSNVSLVFIEKLFNKYGVRKGDEELISFEGFEHLLQSLGIGNLAINDHSLEDHYQTNTFVDIHTHHNHTLEQVPDHVHRTDEDHLEEIIVHHNISVDDVRKVQQSALANSTARNSTSNDSVSPLPSTTTAATTTTTTATTGGVTTVNTTTVAATTVQTTTVHTTTVQNVSSTTSVKSTATNSTGIQNDTDSNLENKSSANGVLVREKRSPVAPPVEKKVSL